MSKRILLTAFRNTSAQLLLQGVTEYRTLLLPNDKRRDSEIMIDVISREKFDYILSIGQKPNIKNKVYVETTAREGEMQIRTDADCESLTGLFEKHGICTKISHNAGTSYCNQLYLNGLHYLSQKTMDTRMVFVHIPLAKNIEDLEDFRGRFLNVISCMKEGLI